MEIEGSNKKFSLSYSKIKELNSFRTSLVMGYWHLDCW